MTNARAPKPTRGATVPPLLTRTTTMPVFLLALCLATLAAVLIPLPQAISAAVGASGSASFAATADTFVTARRPETNFGRTRSLRVNASQPAQTYLRFRVREVAGGITDASLRLYALRGSDAGYEVFRSAGSGWSEHSIDYKNAPATSELIARSGPVDPGWTEVDVSELISSEGVYTLVVTTSDAGGLRFASGDAGASRGTAAPRPKKPKRSPTVVVETDPTGEPSPTPSGEAAGCLSRSSVELLPSSPTAAYVRSSFPTDHTFDARARYDTTYPSLDNYSVDVGRTSGGLNACYIGGTYVGQQSRSITWQDSKAIGGAALRFEHQGGAYIAGVMADNHHDGIDLRANNPTNPTSGDGWRIENWYLRYIRDDAVAADDLTSGTVSDVLFDGVFVGFSAARDGSQPDQSSERILFENALIRLQQMPSTSTTRGVDHGDLLKWSSYAPRPVIRNSVFLIEHSAAGEWPPGTVAENVTIVYTGSGTVSLDRIPGVTFTSDIGVWNTARQDWLNRHGCSGFGNCSRLSAPIPPS
jgi:hypothetical protein